MVKIMKNKRIKKVERKTRETDIAIEWNLDGTGKVDIQTGIGFFDHMLELFAVHGQFDLNVVCKGDLKVDGHHSVEDVGIVMGKLLSELVGDKKGMARYGLSYVPMDESLARCVVDVSGRPYLVFGGEGLKGKVGEFDLELVEEFFRAVSTYGGLTLHIDVLHGSNTHHKAEAVFKAFARSLGAAVAIVGDKILSSKGMLE